MGLGMTRLLRTSVMLFFAVAIAVPLGAVITVALFPFWSWIEASTGIESIGHSGPATWCFVATLLPIASLASLAVLRSQGVRRP